MSDWQSCDECATLLERGNWEALTRRAFTAARKRGHKDGLGWDVFEEMYCQLRGYVTAAFAFLMVDAVLIAVPAEHVRYHSLLRVRTAQEPKKVPFVSLRQAQIDLSTRHLPAKAGTQLTPLVFVLFDVALRTLDLAHVRRTADAEAANRS